MKAAPESKCSGPERVSRFVSVAVLPVPGWRFSAGDAAAGMQQNWAAQPGNSAPAQAYAQPGYTGWRYAPAACKRRTSYKLAGILSGIGALLAVSPFLA